MYETTDEEFESLMEIAIDSIPEEFLKDLDNVYFTYEDCKHFSENGLLVLGQYIGIPRTSRSATSYGAYSASPDKIVLYKRSIEYVCDTYEQLAEQVRKTTVHEVAHYFGMNEAQVRAMGY